MFAMPDLRQHQPPLNSAGEQMSPRASSFPRIQPTQPLNHQLISTLGTVKERVVQEDPHHSTSQCISAGSDALGACVPVWGEKALFVMFYVFICVVPIGCYFYYLIFLLMPLFLLSSLIWFFICMIFFQLRIFIFEMTKFYHKERKKWIRVMGQGVTSYLPKDNSAVVLWKKHNY